jgi:hypothetical protein
MRLGWSELSREKSSCVTAGLARLHGIVAFDFRLDLSLALSSVCVLLSGARRVV